MVQVIIGILFMVIAISGWSFLLVKYFTLARDIRDRKPPTEEEQRRMVVEIIGEERLARMAKSKAEEEARQELIDKYLEEHRVRQMMKLQEDVKTAIYGKRGY